MHPTAMAASLPGSRFMWLINLGTTVPGRTILPQLVRVKAQRLGCFQP